MNKAKVWLAVLLVFILGVLSGALGTRTYIRYRITHFSARGPEARTAVMMKRLSRHLDLTEAQAVEIEQILRESHEQIDAIKQKFRPEIRKIIDSSFTLIREKLDDEQKEKLDQFREKLKKRRDSPPPPV